ncbi:hypothetical protein HRbin39_01605 [bacterium HR39]|nr:hypothetical protein HRbin39_01605 [bacterium HR39]
MTPRWLFAGTAAVALLTALPASALDLCLVDDPSVCPAADGALSVGAAAMMAQTPPYQFDPPNPYANKKPKTANDIKVQQLVVFGDDHSAAALDYPLWHQVLDADRRFGKVTNYAQVGATSLEADDPSLKTEMDAALRKKGKKPRPDRFEASKKALTVVYFGHNDITQVFNLGELADRWNQASSQLDRLLNAGATDRDRRLFLVLPYDYGRTPGTTGAAATALQSFSIRWANDLTDYANAHANVVAVDFFTFSNRVLDNPTDWGLDSSSAFFNTEGVEPVNGSLMRANLSQRGHELLAALVEHYVTQGWNWSNTLAGGPETVARLNQDIDEGLIGAFAEAEARDLSLFAFPVGTAEPTFRFGEADAATSGVGLGWRIGADTAVAFVQAGGEAHGRAERDGGAVRSDSSLALSGVALVQRGEGWTAQTRLLWGEEDVVRRNFDALTGTVTRGGTDGSWLQFSQRFEGERETPAGTLRPWASVDVTRRRIDGYAMSDPYLGTARYGGAEATDVTGSFGLAFDAAPIALDAEGTTLRLSAELGYVRDLRADPYEVRVQLGENSRWTERIERPERSDVFAGFSATLQLGEATALGARYGFAHGVAGTDQAFGVSFTRRF